MPREFHGRLLNWQEVADRLNPKAKFRMSRNSVMRAMHRNDIAPITESWDEADIEEYLIYREFPHVFKLRVSFPEWRDNKILYKQWEESEGNNG